MWVWLEGERAEMEGLVKFWYLGNWSPSVIDVPITKGGKVPLP